MDLFRLKKNRQSVFYARSYCLGMMQPNPIYVRYTSEELESCNIIIVCGFTGAIRAVAKARSKPTKQS